LVRGTERVGLLVVGFDTAPASSTVDGDAAEAADVFMAALELFSLRQAAELQRDVRALLDEFSASLSATLSLTAGLDIFCHGANRLFGADRTSVWIHERRARHLMLQASSDPAGVARGIRVGTEDATAPAAMAMRRTRAEIVSQSEGDFTAMLTVPLRGYRRALGTVVFEGVASSRRRARLLDRRRASRQLERRENMQLLDDVMRSRRELNTFDWISHLVAVSDTLAHRAREPGVRVAGRPQREELKPARRPPGAELVQCWRGTVDQRPAAAGARRRRPAKS
jgi:hypothetical protein